MASDRPLVLNADDREGFALRLGLDLLERADECGGICGRCAGRGEYLYSDTSTWRRRPSGQAMTFGACDLCWGSGRATPWPSWRERESLMAEVERLRALLSSALPYVRWTTDQDAASYETNRDLALAAPRLAANMEAAIAPPKETP